MWSHRCGEVSGSGFSAAQPIRAEHRRRFTVHSAPESSRQHAAKHKREKWTLNNYSGSHAHLRHSREKATLYTIMHHFSVIWDNSRQIFRFGHSPLTMRSPARLATTEVKPPFIPEPQEGFLSSPWDTFILPVSRGKVREMNGEHRPLSGGSD